MSHLPPISKRAIDTNKALDMIFRTVWPEHKGFWEKIFSLLSYAVPFIPGLGWAVFILEQAAHYLFDFGLADIGKALDKSGVMGTMYGLYEGLSGLIEKNAAYDGPVMIEKRAFIGGLLKLTGSLPKVVKIIWGVVKWLMLAIGVSSIDELIRKGDELAKGLLQGNPLVQLLSPDIGEIALPDKEQGAGDLDIGQLKSLMDPSQLTKMFGGGVLPQ